VVYLPILWLLDLLVRLRLSSHLVLLRRVLLQRVSHLLEVLLGVVWREEQQLELEVEGTLFSVVREAEGCAV
jgi:hypothetical protein